jgi:hypothetical protein
MRKLVKMFLFLIHAANYGRIILSGSKAGFTSLA